MKKILIILTVLYAFIGFYLSPVGKVNAQYCVPITYSCVGTSSCETDGSCGTSCLPCANGCNGATGTCNPTSTIQGTVYIDTNGNGIKDFGESGYNGATVTAFPTSGGSFSDGTNLSGFYSIPGLNDDLYIVQLTVPAGYAATTANPVNIFTLHNTYTVNFGIRQTYTISGTVFDDFGSGTTSNNGNGIKDAGEAAHSGVTVNNGASTTSSNGSGSYTFSGLTSGTYNNINVVPPAGYSVTTPNPASATLPPNATVNFGLLLPPPACSGGMSAGSNLVNPGSSTTLSVTSCTDTVPPFVWDPDTPPGSHNPPPTTSGQTDTPTSSTVTWNAPACPTSTFVYVPKVTANGPGGSTSYTTNITVPSTYTVTANVRSVTDPTSCTPTDGTAYNNGAGGGANVNLRRTGGGYDQSQTTDPGTGTTAFSCVLGSNYQLTLSIPSGYTLTGTALNGVKTVPGSNPISMSPLSSNSTATFCIAPINPWFQTDKGDVRFLNLTNPVPAGKLGSSDATYPGIYYSSNSNVNVGFGSVSSKNWEINNEYAYNADTQNRNGGMSYDFYKSKANQTGVSITPIASGTFDQTQITGSGVYEAPGDLAINLYTHVNGRRVVILVDGNVTINAPIAIPQNQGIFILAAKGNITVAKTVGVAYNTDYVLGTSNTHSLDGFYTAEGSILVDGDTCPDGSTADLRLNVGGALIANSLKPFALSGVGTIQNKRSVCANSVNYPSLFVASRPDFITQMTDFYKTSYTKWQEVNP